MIIQIFTPFFFIITKIVENLFNGCYDSSSEVGNTAPPTTANREIPK